jgi:hypothetical protein
MQITNRSKFLVSVMSFILLVSSACTAPKPAASTATPAAPTVPPTSTVEIKIIAPTQSVLATNSPQPEETQAPALESTIAETATATEMPTKELVPITATPMPIGLGRSHPFPMGEKIIAPNWEIQVLEYKRGEAAWNDLLAINPENPPAPPGQEYILVKLRAKSTYADKDQHELSSSDFKVTGDWLTAYQALPVTVPEPALSDTVISGNETEGWAAFLSALGEKNLMLIVDEVNNDRPDRFRYIALDPGAAVSLDVSLADIQPTSLGNSPDQPAPRSSKIFTQGWEAWVVDVVRGDPAWQMILQANPENEAPAEGMEYIAVKVHVRYLSAEDQAAFIDNFYFSASDSSGAVYDFTSLTNPPPALEVFLFPGGESEGWIVVQAARDANGTLLVFESLLDDTGENKRFFSLE